ncbi:hypothetical protein EDD21DRAFT_285335, partial [Dissophora ornata]
IPVFFFLAVVFGKRGAYPGPYRNVEKGLLILMTIEKKIDKLDCIAVDGGYTQHLAGIVNSSELLTGKNITSPIRKPKGIELTVEEKRHNEEFGSFRSTIESYFGDMQSTFTKFSHTVVNRVSDKGIFALQYKLACLLLNIKRMVALRGIDSAPHHNMWMQDEFEYP